MGERAANVHDLLEAAAVVAADEPLARLLKCVRDV
jgi:hypothetical protein